MYTFMYTWVTDEAFPFGLGTMLAFSPSSIPASASGIHYFSFEAPCPLYPWLL